MRRKPRTGRKKRGDSPPAAAAPAHTVLLGEDETVLRLCPVLRRAWALRGEQARVAMTGCNAQRVVCGAINLRTGHRVVLRRPHREQAHFQAFLRLLREAYPGRSIALLLDEAPCHRAAKRQALAAQLGIALLWLPKQCAELNPMDQLWHELKGHISANYQ